MIQLVAVDRNHGQERPKRPTSQEHARYVAPSVDSIAWPQSHPDTVTACSSHMADAPVRSAR